MGDARQEITLKTLMQHIQRAYILRDKKNFDQAYQIAKNCLAQFPQHPDVNCLIGVIQLDRKHYQEAEKFIHTAISLQPAKADYHFLLGHLLKTVGRLSEAEDAYLQCLKIKKDHVLCLLNLGGVYEKQNKLREASRALQQAIKIKPDFYKAYYSLGVVYQRQEKITDAIAAYEKAEQSDVNKLALYSNLGVALTKDRQFEKAISYYHQALDISPDYLPAISNLGGTYIEMNMFREAEKYLRMSLQKEINLPTNWRNLTMCVTYASLEDSDIIQVEKLIKNPALSDIDKTHYYFSLGKMYHDCKQYDKAFECYALGNQLRAKQSAFDVNEFKSRIARVIEHFDQALFRKIKIDNDTHPQPIFIVGTPRSGKSLLEGILKQNPVIKEGGEIGLAEHGSKVSTENSPKGNFPFWVKSLTQDQAIAIREAYLKRLRRDSKNGDRYVMDTLPGNFLYIGLLALLFPSAKFILCKRQALDVCLLMYFKYFVGGHSYTSTLPTAGVYHQFYQSIMDFWAKRIPQKIIEVNYEDVVSKPEETLKKIMAHLDLDTNTKFDFSKIHALEQNVHQHYDKYLAPLKEVLSEKIDLI